MIITWLVTWRISPSFLSVCFLTRTPCPHLYSSCVNATQSPRPRPPRVLTWTQTSRLRHLATRTPRLWFPRLLFSRRYSRVCYSRVSLSKLAFPPEHSLSPWISLFNAFTHWFPGFRRSRISLYLLKIRRVFSLSSWLTILLVMRVISLSSCFPISLVMRVFSLSSWLSPFHLVNLYYSWFMLFGTNTFFDCVQLLLDNLDMLVFDMLMPVTCLYCLSLHATI